jgi:integrase
MKSEGEKVRRERGQRRVFRFKHSRRWWIQYYVRGERKREPSHSTKRGVAEKLLQRRQGEMAVGRYVGPEAERVTVADLLRMVEDDYRLNERKSKPPLGQLRAYFPEHLRALDVTAGVVRSFMDHRLKGGAARQTVRLEVAVLGRGFTLAYRARLLAEKPYLPTLRVKNARTGFFTDAEVARLLSRLPDYMRPFTEAAYITGWRRGELLSLRWAQVDWEAGTMRLERGTTKSGEPRTFPFSAHPRLAALLRQQLAQKEALEREGIICPWVFHRDGQQVRGWYYDGWQTACEKAGLPGRLFHDLRRSAVRNLVRAGVSERVAMTLSGHQSRSVFDRYNIVSTTDQTEAVRKLAALQGSTPEPQQVVVLRARSR